MASLSKNPGLEEAIAFVIGRIEDEARRSTQPLDDSERAYLQQLPVISYLGPDVEAPTPVSRDLLHEKLTALASCAIERDRVLDPEGFVEWQRALAVLKLHSHPLGTLLESGGLAIPRSWWDGWLLVSAALLLIAMAFGAMFAWSEVAESRTSSVRALLMSATVLCAAGALALIVGVIKAERSRLREVARGMKHRGGAD